MADAAVGFARQFVHPAFDEEPGAFEPGRVELRRDLDRLAPHKGAAAERQGEMKAVPGGQHAAAAGGEDDRYDRHVGEAGNIDDPAARLCCRAARTVRGDADALAGSEPLQHRAQCRRPAAPARSGDRVDAEIGDRVGDDPPIAMRRNQHVHRCDALPGHRDHQEAAVPERKNEAASLCAQPAGHLAALHRPAVGGEDEADIEMDDPAGQKAQSAAAQEAPSPAARRLHDSPAASATGASSRSAANWVS